MRRRRHCAMARGGGSAVLQRARGRGLNHTARQQLDAMTAGVEAAARQGALACYTGWEMRRCGVWKDAGACAAQCEE